MPSSSGRAFLPLRSARALVLKHATLEWRGRVALVVRSLLPLVLLVATFIVQRSLDAALFKPELTLATPVVAPELLLNFRFVLSASLATFYNHFQLLVEPSAAAAATTTTTTTTTTSSSRSLEIARLRDCLGALTPRNELRGVLGNISQIEFSRQREQRLFVPFAVDLTDNATLATLQRRIYEQLGELDQDLVRIGTHPPIAAFYDIPDAIVLIHACQLNDDDKDDDDKDDDASSSAAATSSHQRNFTYTLAAYDDLAVVSRHGSMPADLYTVYTAALYQSLLDSAFLVSAGGTRALVATSMQPFPYRPEQLRINIFELSSIILIPLALSLLLPSFQYSLMLDAEGGQRFMMQILGLGLPAYYLVSCCFFYVLYVFNAAVFIALSLAFGTRFFTQTSFAVVLALFACWGVTMIAQACFNATLSRSPPFAMMLSFFFIVVSVIVSTAVNVFLLGLDSFAPTWLLLIPQFAFFRGVYVIFQTCANMQCLRLSDVLTPSHVGFELTLICGLLLVEALVLGLLTIYSDQVAQRSFGVARSRLFPLAALFRLLAPRLAPLRLRLALAGLWQRLRRRRARRRISSDYHPLATTTTTTTTTSFSSSSSLHSNQHLASARSIELPNLHDDANEENDGRLLDGEDLVLSAERVNDSDDRDVPRARLDDDDEDSLDEQCAMRVSALCKSYDGGKSFALRDASLAVSAGECLCLLGPNGAGKTTLIQILTGVHRATSGSVRVRGSIGYVPQFDMLWGELSVREHLLFYARLRGVERSRESACVEDMIARVSLTDAADRFAAKLSGGMRRRLSIAIALVGDPRIVVCDEPSAGLDPLAQRELWKILQSERADRALLLSTHSMEEADVLATRVAVLVAGRVRSIGTPAELKRGLGEDRLQVVLAESEEEGEAEEEEALSSASSSASTQRLRLRASEIVTSILATPQPLHVDARPPRLVDMFVPSSHRGVVFTFQFAHLDEAHFVELFRRLERERRLREFALSPALLEDVFVSLVRAADREGQAGEDEV